jgi:multiple sugar transport system permease protein
MERHTDYAKIEKQARIRSRVRSTVVHILLSLWAVIVLFPFYWMVLTSVKSYSAYNSEYIPKFFTLSQTTSTPLRRCPSGVISPIRWYSL